MINVTRDAQEYFRHLIGQQDAEGLGLRISVVNPGTPKAGCDLQFCPEGTQQDTDQRQPLDGFDLFIAAESLSWLNDAEIDFEQQETTGQLTIRAPNIKGTAPDDDASLGERVAWVLDSEINPSLASHGGRVALQGITDAGEVVLQFGGGCHGCGMVDVTLKQGIETTLRQHFPEITAILDATDHATGENPYYPSDSEQGAG